MSAFRRRVGYPSESSYGSVTTVATPRSVSRKHECPNHVISIPLLPPMNCLELYQTTIERLRFQRMNHRKTKPARGSWPARRPWFVGVPLYLLVARVIEL